MAVAAPLVLREGDRARLQALTRATSVRAGLAQRARIVLLAADGLPNAEIARRTGSTRPTVLAWRNRYAAGGISALGDKPRSGRPAKVDEIEVIATTLADDGKPPAHLGAPCWSSRLLAKELGVSFATVARIWRKWGIQPDRVEAFRFAPDPQLNVDAAGLALVEKSPELPTHRLQETGRAMQRPAELPDPWLNLVEVSLGILTQQAIRRGTFASIHNLIEALSTLTEGWTEQTEALPRPGQAASDQPKDCKAISRTPQPCRRSAPAKVDLRGSSARAGGGPSNGQPLQPELHEARCGSTGRPNAADD
ncbi:MAG TPA: helix-turn-helix domain-containing protein [Pseudonocardiaceae bacterium]|jgi:transposase|nr:helix-turn-helix domain-containing protein [Pseudonocardiaceae bacterium]